MMHAWKWGAGIWRAVAAATLALGPLATVAGPSVSIPSTPDVAGQVHVRGAGVAAHSNVTARFTHQQLAPIDMVVQAAANGSFAIRFEPQINGAYDVVVFDGSGRPIGTGKFGYFR